MNAGPYTAHDATPLNDFHPVWNVKGPGYDRLITGDHHKGVAEHARALAADLNIAYAEGRKSTGAKA